MTPNEIIDKWLNEKIIALKNDYNAKGFRASGNYEDKLKGEYTVTDSKIVVKIIGANYSEFLENGRRKTEKTGTGLLKEHILDWIERKGIKQKEPKMKLETLAFLITRKIHREGYQIAPERKNVISNTINKDSVKELIDSLKINYAYTVASDIRKLFKK